METDPKQLEIIHLMAQVELKMSEIYTIYAERFADQKDFWLELEEEERDHAGWITKFEKKLTSKQVFINKGRFRKQGILYFLNYLTGLEQKAMTEQRLVVALADSHDIESALLEKRYFEIFDTDSAELRNVLSSLETATIEHLKKVDAMLQAVRQVLS